MNRSLHGERAANLEFAITQTHAAMSGMSVRQRQADIDGIRRVDATQNCPEIVDRDFRSVSSCRILEQVRFARNRTRSSFLRISHFRTEIRIPLFLKMLQFNQKLMVVRAPTTTALCMVSAGLFGSGTLPLGWTIYCTSGCSVHQGASWMM